MNSTRVGVIGFPGSTDDRDALLALQTLGADAAAARAELDKMCRHLLANPLIESYEIEIAE